MAWEYYRLRRDKRFANCIAPLQLPSGYEWGKKISRQKFQEAENLAIVLYDDESPLVDVPDVLFDPAFMLADRLLKTWQDLMPDDEPQAWQYLLHSDIFPENVPKNDKLRPLYWVPFLPAQDILHETVECYGTGQAREVILSEQKLRDIPLKYRSVIYVDQPGDDIWLASLLAVERMLSQQATGFVIEKVRIL